MGKAKDIIIKPIRAKDAIRIVKKLHYSGKVVNNSQLHFGVFLAGKCEGALQYGPSLDKRKMLGLVGGTKWNEFIELNRMAFSDVLPRNSESRAIAITIKLIKKHYPHIKWIVSFADATQCGDGTIYRASGFLLTGIKKNTQIWVAPDGEISASSVPTITGGAQRGEALKRISRVSVTKGKHIKETGASSMKPFKDAGYKPLEGYQIRYIYFIDKSAEERLTVPIIPFSKIAEMGAGMYKGKKIERLPVEADPPRVDGGATPTQPLHKITSANA